MAFVVSDIQVRGFIPTEGMKVSLSSRHSRELFWLALGALVSAFHSFVQDIGYYCQMSAKKKKKKGGHKTALYKFICPACQSATTPACLLCAVSMPTRKRKE